MTEYYQHMYVKDLLSRGYRVVHQGGHHDVYCDGKKHVRADGGFCHAPKTGTWVSPAFDCDCNQYTKGE